MSGVSATVLVEGGGWDETTQAMVQRVVDHVFASTGTRWPSEGGASGIVTALAGGKGPVELTVVLTDDETIRDLNRIWRSRDKPTNVLSFPLLGPEGPAPAPDQPILLGDIVLARETIAGEASVQGKALDDHLTHLIVHGLLHLLGFDHDIDSRAEEMEALEISLLGELGLADPYRVREGDNVRVGRKRHEGPETPEGHDEGFEGVS